MMKKCFLCGALLFSVLVSGCYIAEDSSKKNITIETNASSGDKVWFMAASMDSADIPASSVPYFHISRAKSVEAENVRPEKIMIPQMNLMIQEISTLLLSIFQKATPLY